MLAFVRTLYVIPAEMFLKYQSWGRGSEKRNTFTSNYSAKSFQVLMEAYQWLNGLLYGLLFLTDYGLESPPMAQFSHVSFLFLLSKLFLPYGFRNSCA